jgi:hypothetical protein
MVWLLAVVALAVGWQREVRGEEVKGAGGAGGGQGEVTLRCAPGTGAWGVSAQGDDPQGVTLRAALCSREDQPRSQTCPELTTLRFGADGALARADMASTPAAFQRCSLRWLTHLNGMAIYHDGQDLIGVDLDTLRVTTINPLPLKLTPEDGFVISHRGGAVVLESAARLIVLRPTPAGVEVELDLDLSGLITAPIWQRKYGKLLLLSGRQLRWWALDKDGLPTGQPQSRDLSPEVTPHDFTFDRNGLMVANRRQGRSSLAWYPFESDRAEIVLNATEQIRRVGALGDPERAVALTTDVLQADLTGIQPPWKQPRDLFTHRYWRVVEDTLADIGGPPGAMMMGAGDFFAVDGSSTPPPTSRNRIIIITTAESPWQRTTEFDLPTPGRMIAMTPTYLVTYHPTGDIALAVWRLDRSGLLRSVSRADYDRAGLEGLPSLASMSDDLFMLTDGQSHLAVFNAASAAFSVPVPPDATLTRQTEAHPRFTLITESSAAEPGAPLSVVRWHQLDSRGEHKVFTLGPVKPHDAFNTTTRWFGYCPPVVAGVEPSKRPLCALSFPAYERAQGSDAHLLSMLQTAPPSAPRPLQMPLTLAGASALMLLLISAWRLDWGRRAQHESTSTAAPPTELIPVDLDLNGELRTATMPPPDPQATPFSANRGLLTINPQGVRLSLPNHPDQQLAIDLDLDLTLTRQIDFANQTPGGLLTMTFFSNKNNQRQEIALDVQIPADVRPFEHIPYRDTLNAARTSWEAVIPLLENLKRHPNMQQTLYRKLTRQARPGETPTREPSGLIEVSHLLDPQGRRYITDDDWSGFVRPSRWQSWPVRMLLALSGGAAAALPLMMVHLGVEAPLTIAVVSLSLGLPVTVLLWVGLSWGIWNRIHLLRFGRAVRGTWNGSDTLHFSLLDGRTFRLNRKLWERQDLLPVVLSDPRRPRFAVHFTGHRSVGTPQSSSPVGKVRRAWSGDTSRLLPLVVLFAGLFVLAYQTFWTVFPEPLPAAQLDAIVEEAAGKPMLMPCLATCQALPDPTKHAACATQCRQRQARLTFAPLVSLTADVTTDPGLLVKTQLDAFEEVLQPLIAAATATPETPTADLPTCDSLAAPLQALPRWTPALQGAIAAVYGASPALLKDSPALAAANARLDALQQTFLNPLCSPSPACLSNPDQSCPPPPACVGPTDTLRQALCTLAPAVSPIASVVAPAPSIPSPPPPASPASPPSPAAPSPPAR